MVDTDRQDVVISGLNDYTGGKLKGEASDFQTSKTLKTAKLCSATHAGHEDNPKGKKMMKNFKVARTNMTIRGEGGIRLDSWNLSPEASERLVVVFNQFYTFFS